MDILFYQRWGHDNVLQWHILQRWQLGIGSLVPTKSGAAWNPHVANEVPIVGIYGIYAIPWILVGPAGSWNCCHFFLFQKSLSSICLESSVHSPGYPLLFNFWWVYLGPKPLLTHELQTIIPKLVLHWSIHRIHLFQNLSNDSSFFLLSTLFHYHFTRRRTEKASLSTSNLRADSDGSESPIEKKAKIICLMEKNPRHLDNYPYDSIWLRGGERKKNIYQSFQSLAIWPPPKVQPM